MEAVIAVLKGITVAATLEGHTATTARIAFAGSSLTILVSPTGSAGASATITAACFVRAIRNAGRFALIGPVTELSIGTGSTRSTTAIIAARFAITGRYATFALT